MQKIANSYWGWLEAVSNLPIFQEMLQQICAWKRQNKICFIICPWNGKLEPQSPLFPFHSLPNQKCFPLLNSSTEGQLCSIYKLRFQLSQMCFLKKFYAKPRFMNKNMNVQGRIKQKIDWKKKNKNHLCFVILIRAKTIPSKALAKFLQPLTLYLTSKPGDPSGVRQQEKKNKKRKTNRFFSSLTSPSQSNKFLQTA